MTLEPAIKGPDDYKKLVDIFSKARIVPAADFDRVLYIRDLVEKEGGRGI